MAALIAPDVVRVTFNGTYGGQPVANVFDIIPRVIAGGPPARSAFIEDLLPPLMEAWANYVDFYITAVQYQSLNFVDLNSADGTVGTVDFPVQAQGLVAGSPMPGNVSVRINKSSGGYQRGQRAGRFYMPGCAEEWTGDLGPNTIQNNVRGDLQTASNAFLTAVQAITGEEGGNEWEARMVVVHTSKPDPESDPVYTGRTVVTALAVQARLASQRRRLTL